MEINLEGESGNRVQNLLDKQHDKYINEIKAEQNGSPEEDFSTNFSTSTKEGEKMHAREILMTGRYSTFLHSVKLMLEGMLETMVD